MRIQVVVPLIYFACTVAHAASWKHVATFPTVVTEIDVKSVRARGGMIEGTFRFNHPTPQESHIASGQFMSAEVKLWFDCKQGRYVPYHRTEFEKTNGQGAVVGTFSVSGLPPPSKLKPATQGAMDQEMLRAACSFAPR
jgi:hypothetical protein